MKKKRGTRDAFLKSYKKLPKNILILIIILVIGGIIFVAFQNTISEDESTIIRKFSSTTINAGDEVDVTLFVAIGGDETYYALEEYIPDMWVIINDGEGGDNLKWVVIQDAKSTTYSYTLIAPDKKGDYVFSGNYIFEGATETTTTQGQTTVTVI